MPEDFQIVLNTDELAKLKVNLESISKAMEKSIAQKALYSAAAIVAQTARYTIEEMGLVDTGNLRRSIGVSQIKLPTGKVGVKVGILSWSGTLAVRVAQSAPGTEGIDRSAFYGRFLESGTKYIIARHWMQRAGVASSQACVDRFIVKASELFEDAAAKLAK